ncbi:Polyphosphate kinase [Streptomyces glaucescens]
MQAFLEQAAQDPDVLAIKQTLYRTPGDSPIVDALIDAAESGKQVLVLVEIKARFDEHANIKWARKLEEAGCHVVYGLVGLKTHCKLSLVVRQEGDTLRRYSHVGTGNYHPKTARLYEDLGLLTADPQVGADLSDLFNRLSGYSRRETYRRLLVAPKSLRDGLISRIDKEIQHHRAGRPAHVRIKVNSMVDEAVIRTGLLWRALAGGRLEICLVHGRNHEHSVAPQGQAQPLRDRLSGALHEVEAKTGRTGTPGAELPPCTTWRTAVQEVRCWAAGRSRNLHAERRGRPDRVAGARRGPRPPQPRDPELVANCWPPCAGPEGRRGVRRFTPRRHVPPRPSAPGCAPDGGPAQPHHAGLGGRHSILHPHTPAGYIVLDFAGYAPLTGRPDRPPCTAPVPITLPDGRHWGTAR